MSTHAPPPPRHREWKIGCKVYIGNLAEGASKQDIESAFGKYGQLRNVWVARNPPGFAFVEFEDGRDAEDACRHLDGTRIAGSRIKAEMSHGRTRRTRPGGYRGGGPPHLGGGYGGRGPYHGGHHRGEHHHHNGAGDYPYPPHHGPPRGGHGPPYMERHPRERHPPKPRSPDPVKEFRRFSRSRSNSVEKSPGLNRMPRTPPSRAS